MSTASKTDTTMQSKSIFIAFTGPDIQQEQLIAEIALGFECWNLKKFTVDTFIAQLQKKIPPVNANVTRNYRASDADPNPDFGLRQKDYEHCSWGLLLPNGVPESLGGYGETLFLLSLYSPHFLYPTFYATDFGLQRSQQPKNRLLYFHDQNQAHRFSKKAFVEFHKALASEAVYAVWQADRVSRWNREDWRLFTACLLFSGLRQYEYSKQIFGWQRESADLATILEALFTAGGDDNTEVGYKLRKRIAVLLSPHISNIEKEVKDLYGQRSAFVHGSFFAHIHRDTKVTDGLAELPPPPFFFLRRQKEHVRRALVSYLYLSKLYRTEPNRFGGCKSILDSLEEAIIDLELRSVIERHTADILGLL